MLPSKTQNFAVKILNNQTKLQDIQKIQLSFADDLVDTKTRAETKYIPSCWLLVEAYTVLLRLSRNCRGMF